MNTIKLTDESVISYDENERAYFNIIKYQHKYRATDINKDLTVETDTLKDLEQWLLYNVPNYRINNYDEYALLKR